MADPTTITGSFYKNSNLRMGAVFKLLMVINFFALGFFLSEGLRQREVYYSFVVHNPVYSGAVALVVLFTVLFPLYRYRETQRKIKITFTSGGKDGLALTVADGKPVNVPLPAYSIAGTIKVSPAKGVEQDIFRLVIWIPNSHPLILDEAVPPGVTAMESPDLEKLNTRSPLHYTGAALYPGPVHDIVKAILGPDWRKDRKK